ncbi:uncharacterized protein VTP21DRAFT_7624 [Calcarisporiella thermophila]|uniref:uncharacterized protein n=1 Tax=Calcarisporiella thermophila TaxID=911321 RepID=UPI0037448D8D
MPATSERSSRLISGEAAVYHATLSLNDDFALLAAHTSQPVSQENNVLGRPVNVLSQGPTADVFEQIYPLLAEGRLVSVHADSNSLIPLIPHLYRVTSDKSAVVVHVSANHLSGPSYGDFTQVMAVRQSGLALLSSASVQEAYDLSVIARVVSIVADAPFLHFYDSRRVSHEYVDAEIIAKDALLKLLTEEEVENYRARLAERRESKPATSSYLRYKEGKPTESASNIHDAFDQVAKKFAQVTGRSYSPFEYTGAPDAERVVVAIGAGSRVVEHVVRQAKEEKLGVLRVRLYRPWSEHHFLERLPKTVKKVAVLEPTEDSTSTWNPLFLDVVAAFQNASLWSAEIPLVVSGRYGVDSQDFSPAMVRAVFDELSSNEPHRRFAVGSSELEGDGYQTLEVPSTPVNVLPETAKQAIIYGASESLLATIRDAILIGEEGAAVQTYSVNEQAHLRCHPVDTPHLPSLITSNANAIILVDPSFASSVSFSALSEGGVVLLFSLQANVDELNRKLPALVRRNIAQRKALLFVSSYTAKDETSVASVLAYIHFANDDVGKRRVLDYLGGDDKAENLTLVDVPESWASLESSDEAAAATGPTASLDTKPPTLPLETPYVKMLAQVFGERLDITNGVLTDNVWGPHADDALKNNPEYGFGRLLAQHQKREQYARKVANVLKTDTTLAEPLHKALSEWLILRKDPRSRKLSALVSDVEKLLDEHLPHSELSRERSWLKPSTSWLIGSDSWAHDLGQSGVHHVIASGENINLLLIDTTPYSQPVPVEKRKKDVGLYAMNYGSVYVASVAIYSSYTGVLNAMMEADAYPGPSVILAYLPQLDSQDEPHPSPLAALQETKRAVDSGAWPLYRWNPALEAEGKDPFSLESPRIKRDLEAFLDRENHLSLLVKESPEFSKALVSSLESDVARRHEELKRKAREDYARLIGGLSANGASVVFLFGSDNGNAEGVAKKLAMRGKARGLRTRLMAMDDYSDVADLASEPNVVIVTSTAGQGEFPQNSREFWKVLNDKTAGDLNLADTKYAVFGLGDSHYWPLPEDRIYYNRPARLVDAKLEGLGATPLCDIGLGDDQDPDGFETGLAAWEPQLWKALGVDTAAADEDVPKYTDDDHKRNSNFLRGTIAQEMADPNTTYVTEGAMKLLKFHGTYMQDDRDLREERKRQGLEKAYSFMVRVRVPGGVSTPEQWLAMDEISTRYANNTLKLTTRQAFQFHGVLKSNLKQTIREINRNLLDTLAACGDVNRNVMCSVNPRVSHLHHEVYDFSRRLTQHLTPNTTAYHEIWVEDKPVAGNAVQDYEPLYGPTYLPRKFKIVITVPPDNDVDAYAHDIGFIAIAEAGKLVGYNVLAGGGMGMTHGNKKTYPQVGRMLGFCRKEHAIDVAEKIMLVQRDYGDRTNRKHARLKYTIDDRGVEWFRAEVEKYLGYSFEAARPFTLDTNTDRYGWTQGADGKWHFGMYIENGRVHDSVDHRIKTGLREIAKVHKGDFRLTPNQHLVIGNIASEDVDTIKALLAEYRLDNLDYTGLRLNSMACVALPTCGLAMAESERYLPVLVSKVEDLVMEAGLRDDAITIRMTGCPNGCARPYVAEIAFVGKAPGAYNMYLGGGHYGQRLNKLYRESIREEEIIRELGPMLKRYATEREEGEKFGDWVIRAGYVKASTDGTNFHS